MRADDHPRVAVTSLAVPAPAMLHAEISCARGTCANAIKAVKVALRSARPSATTLPAHALRLLLACAAQFNCIGAMARMLYNQPPTPLEAAHRVRIACGAPVPVEICADFERRFHLTVLETYGLSECPMGTSNLANMRKIGSMGKPARHPDPELYTRVRLVDDVERDVPVGQVGEVLLQSPALMVGYYRDPERTAEAMRGDWFHTGDYARQDEDGFFFCSMRKW